MFPSEQPDILENPRKRRKDVFLEMTRSLCSKCLCVVDAKILKTDDDKIILRKWCPDHGFESCLLHSDDQLVLPCYKNLTAPETFPTKIPHRSGSRVSL